MVAPQTSGAQTKRAKIDGINSASDVENLLSSIDKKRFELFEVRGLLRFGDKACTEYANSIKAKSWTKADFDGDGNTDLLILGDYFGPASIVIMDSGRDKYSVKVLSQSECSVPVVEYEKSIPVIILKARDDWKPNYKLVFKFGNFVEENPTPPNYRIERIEYSRHGCFGECPVFTFDIRSEGRAEFNAVAFNIGKKGKFHTELSPKTFQQLVFLLNYIDFANLKDEYSVGATDLPGAKLTVTYDHGKVKTIDDYGFRGPFGLQAIHQKFLDLRVNQRWKR